jgi:hypothetical protein
MPQLVLFPDPRPLPERLGVEFFRQAPESPGVYLMRDGSDQVLYVGKARNLRKRLNSYRVANPNRMGRRHLRLLHAVRRIELQECFDEAAALSTEGRLLRSLRPRFNRAGTWTGPLRCFAWRVTANGIELTTLQETESGWECTRPFAGSVQLKHALVRLLWCALYPERGIVAMPGGWFQGRYTGVAMISPHQFTDAIVEECGSLLRSLFRGETERFENWIQARTSTQVHPFEIASREEDLKTIRDIVLKKSR